MPVKSPAMAMLLEPFKVSAAEGAAVELKLRLLAGTMPALQKYAHQRHLEDIEGDLARHFGDSLSPDENEILRFPFTRKGIFSDKLLLSPAPCPEPHALFDGQRQSMITQPESEHSLAVFPIGIRTHLPRFWRFPQDRVTVGRSQGYWQRGHGLLDEADFNQNIKTRVRSCSRPGELNRHKRPPTVLSIK
jgi:hypothetical protein